MSPKEKAVELVGKYIRYTPAELAYEYQYAKKCALIAIDEIINVIEFMAESDEPGKLPYWQQVKIEIDKL